MSASIAEEVRHLVAELGARLISEGHKVLAHCTMGFNRSALMAGLILTKLGYDGPAAVARTTSGAS